MQHEFSGLRRRLLGGGLLTALTGLSACSSTPLGKTMNTFWAEQGNADLFAPEQVQRLPYATLAVKLGDRPRAMMVLMRAEGEDLHWVSADKSVLVTRHGRLVKTVGLAAGNLAGTRMLDSDPLSLPETWSRPCQWRRTVDLLPARLYGLLLVSDWQPEGTEQIRTFHGPREALRVRETTRTTDGRWSMTSRFWLDIQGAAVLASQQQLMPDTPVLGLEPLKPYRA